MKALSLWQPWASLVILGLKHYETRSWKTDYRGTLVIHAAKTWNMTCSDALSHFTNHLHVSVGDAPFGVALGTVELVDILCTEDVPFSTIPILSDEYHFGDFTPGRYAWKLENPIVFPEPIPCAGHQRLWELNDADGLAVIGQGR